MRTIRSLALGAGFFFVTLALFVQGFLPSMIPESRTPRVTRAVRTDLGEVKWVRYEAIDYTPLEQLGRRICPDLSRVGLKYSDDWHYAHHWEPRLTVPDSIMPSFTWLFVPLTVPVS